MLIGKPGEAKSALCTADAERILIRGRDLSRDLMGRMTFTEYFFFLMTGKEATDRQRFFLDLLLVAIAEHGLTPTAIAARMTYDADPQSLQGALAAGILGCGTVILGTAQLCGDVLVEAAKRVDAGEDARCGRDRDGRRHARPRRPDARLRPPGAPSGRSARRRASSRSPMPKASPAAMSTSPGASGRRSRPPGASRW